VLIVIDVKKMIDLAREYGFEVKENKKSRVF